MREDTPAGDNVQVPVELAAPLDGFRWRALGDVARLIVVGSGGHGALRAAVLDLVSSAPSATAPLGLLVVPPIARLRGSATNA